MKDILWIGGLVLWTLTLTLVLRRDNPAFALLIGAMAAALTLYRLAGMAQQEIAALRTLFGQTGLDSEIMLPVLRVAAVSVASHLLAALCRDAGQSALAVQTETAGVLLALFFTLPLLEQVFSLIGRWTG